MVENYYSNTEDKVVTFIKPLMIAFVATLSASFISNFVNRNYFAESIWLLAIPALLYSSIILLFGFVGLTQNYYTRKIVEESAMMEAEEPELEIIPLTPEKEHIMAAEIRRLMDEKRATTSTMPSTEASACRLQNTSIRSALNMPFS